MSVVLHESKETLESAWRLQNEGSHFEPVPLWVREFLLVIIVSY